MDGGLPGDEEILLSAGRGFRLASALGVLLQGRMFGYEADAGALLRIEMAAQRGGQSPQFLALAWRFGRFHAKHFSIVNSRRSTNLRRRRALISIAPDTARGPAPKTPSSPATYNPRTCRQRV